MSTSIGANALATVVNRLIDKVETGERERLISMPNPLGEVAKMFQLSVAGRGDNSVADFGQICGSGWMAARFVSSMLEGLYASANPSHRPDDRHRDGKVCRWARLVCCIDSTSYVSELDIRAELSGGGV